MRPDADAQDDSGDESAEQERPEPPPLARLYGERPEARAWFEAALADAPERSSIGVQGADIELLTWGRRGDPGLLLLHGNSAHADWYSFIAPLVARAGYRVAAMSFSGMGGSAWRERYGLAQWSDEAQAAAEAAGLFDAPVAPWLAAHSFGGFVAMVAAARWGQRLRGTMIVDAPLRSREKQAERNERRRKPQPSRIYQAPEEALMRFRFLPPQRCEHLFVVDHIARYSLKEVEGGWTWRFDPFLFRDFQFSPLQKDIGEAKCPLLLVRGGRSRLVTPALFDYALSLAPAGTRTAEVPDADHHVMVDQPLAFADLLKQTLG